MNSLLPLALLVAIVPVAGATIMPLRSGTYVLSGTSCRDAPFAAMMRYDGKGLSDPHSAQCRSRVLQRAGNRYRVSTTCRANGDGSIGTTCRANGDGSPATPTTEIATLRIRSRTAFVYAVAGPVANASTYRLCPSGSSIDPSPRGAGQP